MAEEILLTWKNLGELLRGLREAESDIEEALAMFPSQDLQKFGDTRNIALRLQDADGKLLTFPLTLIADTTYPKLPGSKTEGEYLQRANHPSTAKINQLVFGRLPPMEEE